MYYEVIINGKHCDLATDTKIALSLATNEIAEMIRPLGAFSNQFKLPKTQNNIDIFEVAHSLNSNTNFPYQKLPARLIINGRELISDGFAIIEQAQQFYEITIYGGNLDFFEKIKDKKLTDLDLSSLDHVWNLRNVIDYRLNDTGVIYPIIDWSSDGKYMNNIEKRIDVRTIFPAVFSYPIMDKIFTEADFNKSGNILTGSKYKSLIVPIVQAEPDSNQKEKLKIFNTKADKWFLDLYLNQTDVQNWSPYIMSAATTDELGLWKYGTITSAKVPENSSGGTAYPWYLFSTYNATTFYYEAYSTGDYQIEFTAHVKNNHTIVPTQSYPNNPNGGTEYLDFWILSPDNKTKKGMSIPISEGTNKIETFKGVVSLKKGDKLFPICYHDFYSPDYWKAEITDSSLLITAKDIPLIEFETNFTIANNLPDMTQTDFIKSIAKIFGIIFQTNSFTKTVEFRQFKEIYDNIPNAKNWSNKLDLSVQPLIQFHAPFAQENILKWSNSSDVPDKLGEGKILVSDTSLEKEKTLIEVSFSATEMSKKLLDNDVPLIKWLEAGAASGTTEPRILILDRTDFACKYSVGNTNASGLMEVVNTSHATCYFQLDSKTFNLGFDNSLIADNYNEFGFFLDKFKQVTCNLLLDENDIYEMDFFTPIYIDYFKHYFFISKINNFIDKRRSTQVELIRL